MKQDRSSPSSLSARSATRSTCARTVLALIVAPIGKTSVSIVAVAA